jgi:hypothetical protein
MDPVRSSVLLTALRVNIRMGRRIERKIAMPTAGPKPTAAPKLTNAQTRVAMLFAMASRVVARDSAHFALLELSVASESGQRKSLLSSFPSAN